MIVDLKTGKTAPKAEENAQLGLYQIAFLEGGLETQTGEGNPLEGASLVLVGGEKVAIKSQPSLEESPDLKENFRHLIDQAIIGMAAEDATFQANIGTHCYDENGYGNCKILLTKAVSYVE
jgi:hypothetical protein